MLWEKDSGTGGGGGVALVAHVLNCLTVWYNTVTKLSTCTITSTPRSLPQLFAPNV